MAKTLLFRRGSTMTLNGLVPASGEIFINTETNTVQVGNNSMAGGIPLAKVSDIAGKQDTLVSANNIKTINGSSILGSGDLTISGGSGSTGAFTFTDNTVSLPANKNAVFNTSGFLNIAFSIRDYSSYYENAPDLPVATFISGVNTVSWDHLVSTQTSPNQLTGISLTGDVLYVIPQTNYHTPQPASLSVLNELSVLLPGSKMTLVSPIGTTITRTIRRIITRIVDDHGDNSIVILFEETGADIGNNDQLNAQTIQVNSLVSSTFSMDGIGTFKTDSLLAGTLYLQDNIITALPSGNYGTTPNPVVINGDLNIIGNISKDSALTVTIPSPYTWGSDYNYFFSGLGLTVGNSISENYTQISRDFLVLQQAGSGTRTQIRPGIFTNAKTVEGTADGCLVERTVIGAKTGGASQSTNIQIVSAANINGDMGAISIIEVVVSAINVDASTPPSILNAKSWKIRGYATNVNNTVTFTQIGTTEVLADTGTGIPSTTSDLSATLNSPGGYIHLTLDQTYNSNIWTWGGEYSVITSHVA